MADLLAEPLPRLTSRTLTPSALREELKDVRERGFAREKDEAILGESSIASPIFDHSGHAIGAIGVVGDTERIMPRGPAKQLAPAVAEAARGVSRELGATRWPTLSPRHRAGLGADLRSALRVDRLSGLEHRDELRQPPSARLGLLGVLEPVQDRVAVLTRQLVEERPGVWTDVELAPEILGDGDRPLALVGRLPAAVGLGPFDLAEAGRPHPAVGGQSLHLVAVDPRPLAPGPTRA